MHSQFCKNWPAFRQLLFAAVVAGILCLAFPASGADEETPEDATNYDGHIALSQEAADIEWRQVWQRYRAPILVLGAVIFALAGASLGLLASNRRQRVLQQQTRDLNRRLSRILQGTRAGTWEWNVQTGEARFNERWAEIVGYPLEALEPVSIATWTRLVHPDDLDRSTAALEKHFCGEAGHYEIEVRMQHREGHWVWVHDSGRVMTRTEDGRPEWMFGTHMDVTELHNAVERVRTAASVFDASGEGICITDENLQLSDVNRAFEALTGYDREDLLGRLPRILLPEDRADATAEDVRAELESRGQWKGEVPIRRKCGETFPAEVSISPVFDDDGAIAHYVGMISDITLRKLHEKELRQIASLDALTGIGNRRQIVAQLDRAVALSRSGSRFAICMMDLDGFKPVNDQYGHDAGDRLLTTIAERLQSLIRVGDFVGRLGGDEFVLILHDPHGETVFERILEVVRQPVRIDDLVVRVTASLGVTFCKTDHSPSAAELMREADQAVYRSKSAGRDRFTYARPGLV